MVGLSAVGDLVLDESDVCGRMECVVELADELADSLHEFLLFEQTMLGFAFSSLMIRDAAFCAVGIIVEQRTSGDTLSITR